MAEQKDGTEHRLHRCISCFAWNADFTQVALSPNDKSILIYKLPSPTAPTKDWELLHTLQEHDSFVSMIDWSHVTNLIVSSGHDRNAYVWRFDGEAWKPTLVILRINRAANCVRWSPDGNKFAVGSGAKVVPVCHYEVSNDWWVSKMIKRHKSSILSIDWHRNNKFLLTGAADFKCRVFSAFISEVDSTDDEEDFENIFKDQHKFGAVLAEFDCSKGWIESVCFSPNGFRAVFVGHDSAINFVQILEGSKPVTQSKKFSSLPFRAVGFLSDDCIVAAGHENNPFLFVNKGDEAEPNWELREKLDKEGKGKKKEKKKVSAFGASRAMFEGASNKGQRFSTASIGPTVLKTRHQNQITEMRVWFADEYTTSSARFYTCGADGRFLCWDLGEMGVSLDGTGIET